MLKLDMQWADKVRPGTKRRKCGIWWTPETSTGKGKGQGHGHPRQQGHGKTTWPRKQHGEQLLDTPLRLTKLRPLKKEKEQHTAADLLATTWDVIPENIQTKLQALGYEPELTKLLKSHMTAPPQAVQEVVLSSLSQFRALRKRSPPPEAQDTGHGFENNLNPENAAAN